MFISHAHTDHIGGCKSLENYYFVAGIMFDTKKILQNEYCVNPVTLTMSYGTVWNQNQTFTTMYSLIKDGDRIVYKKMYYIY